MTTGTKFTPPHTILIATDLSARCDRALDRAVHLARRWKARLIALSVVEPGTLSTKPVRSMPKPSWTDAAHDPVQHAFNQLRRNALATDVNISLRVEEGKVGQMLNQVAKEEDAGLIVTGIARNESLGLAILGSSVDWLARHASVPVLVVRQRSRGPYQSIAVASDYSPTSRVALEASAMDRLVRKLPEALAAAGPVAAAPTKPVDTSYRFDMRQDGRVMQAEEFDAWMKSRRVRVATGKPGIPDRAPGAMPTSLPASPGSQPVAATPPSPVTAAALVASTTPASAGLGDNVVFQIASFSSDQNAQHALALLQGAAIDNARLLNADVNGKKIWRLRIGPVAAATAPELAARVVGLGFGQPQRVRD